MLRLWTDKLQPRDEAEMQIVTEAASPAGACSACGPSKPAPLDLEMDNRADELAGQLETIDEGIRQASAFKKLADESASLELIHRYETRYRRRFEKALATCRPSAKWTSSHSLCRTGLTDNRCRNSWKNPALKPSDQDRINFCQTNRGPASHRPFLSDLRSRVTSES